MQQTDAQLTQLLTQSYSGTGSNPFSGDEVYNLFLGIISSKLNKDNPVDFNSTQDPISFSHPKRVYTGYNVPLVFDLDNAVPGAVVYIEHTTGADPVSEFPTPTAKFKKYNFTISATNWIRIFYLSADNWIVDTPFNPGTGGGGGSTVSVSNDQQNTGSFTITINSTPTTILNDLGTFTGVTIPDNPNLKSALQAIETALEAISVGGSAVSVADDTETDGTFTITIDAVPTQFFDNMGTFTGSTISPSVSIRTVLQELETALETKSVVTSTDDTATTGTFSITVNGSQTTFLADFGTFPGATITNNSDLKTILTELEAAIEAVSGDNMGDHIATQDVDFQGLYDILDAVNGAFSGNLTVGGTVDGRDVSVDGAKLDTIPVAVKTPAANGDIDLSDQYLGARTSDPESPISDAVLTVDDALDVDNGRHDIYHLSANIPQVATPTPPLIYKDYGLASNYGRNNLNLLTFLRAGNVIMGFAAPLIEPSGTGGSGTAITGNPDLVLYIRASSYTGADQSEVLLAEDQGPLNKDMTTTTPGMTFDAALIGFVNAGLEHLANTNTTLTSVEFCVIIVFTPTANMENSDGLWGADDAGAAPFLAWRINSGTFVRVFNGTNWHDASTGIPVSAGVKTMITVNFKAADLLEIFHNGAAEASPTFSGTVAGAVAMNSKAVLGGLLDSGSSFFSEAIFFDFAIFDGDQAANIDAMQAELLAKHPDIGV